jgi:hypothetical protein
VVHLDEKTNRMAAKGREIRNNGNEEKSRILMVLKGSL